MAACAAVALEPPRPGEIEQLRAAGLLEKRLEHARAFSNNVVHPALVQRVMEKLAAARGVPLPPSAKGKLSSSLTSSGTNKILILLVGFKDRTNTYPTAFYSNMVFGAGDAGNYPCESLQKYYLRTSYGNLVLEGDVLGWYYCTNNRSAYVPDGADGSNFDNYRIIKEAAEYWHAQGHDFSQYDNNHDGVIDYFAVFWTGPVGGWASFWWAYMWSLYSADLTLDGVRFGDFVWTWEENNAWTLIHETGHSLGLPDYYDYDDAIGPRGGVGGLDIMDYDIMDHNGFSKFMLDWVQPRYIITNSYNVECRALALYPETTIIMPNVTGDAAFTQFFMAENRQCVGNDSYHSGTWCAHTNGLLVWHVDATPTTPGGTSFRYDNSYSTHKLLRLMEADGIEQIENNGAAGPGDYYNRNETLSPYSKPDSRRYDGANPWGGSNSTVKISVVSPDGEVMTATFEFVSSPLLTNSAALLAAAGDGDAHCEPGENAQLWLWLKNIGGGVASNVTATLTNVGAGLSVVTTGPVSYAALVCDRVASNTMPIMLTIATNCPAGLQSLQAVIGTDCGGWTTAFSVLVETIPAFRPLQTNVLFAVPSGSTDVQSIAISNPGSMALSFVVEPSNTNYTWTDTDRATGPRYSWLDIGAKGTPVPINRDDYVAGSYSIGFVFPFYGLSFSQYQIGMNGAVLLQGSTLPAANANLPSSTVPGALLPAFWDDLFFSTTGYSIYRWNDANQLVVTYCRVPRKGQSFLANTFQIVVRRNGQIRYQYQAMNGTLSSSTVGIQGANQTAKCVAVAYNKGYLKNNLATSYIPPVPPTAPWLSCPTGVFTIAAGCATTFPFLADATILSPGVYTTSVTMTHSDPDASILTVPVRLEVLPEPALACFAMLGFMLHAAARRRR